MLFSLWQLSITNTISHRMERIHRNIILSISNPTHDETKEQLLQHSLIFQMITLGGLILSNYPIRFKTSRFMIGKPTKTTLSNLFSFMVSDFHIKTLLETFCSNRILRICLGYQWYCTCLMYFVAEYPQSLHFSIFGLLIYTLQTHLDNFIITKMQSMYKAKTASLYSFFYEGVLDLCSMQLSSIISIPLECVLIQLIMNSYTGTSINAITSLLFMKKVGCTIIKECYYRFWSSIVFTELGWIYLQFAI